MEIGVEQIVAEGGSEAQRREERVYGNGRRRRGVRILYPRRLFTMPSVVKVLRAVVLLFYSIEVRVHMGMMADTKITNNDTKRVKESKK